MNTISLPDIEKYVEENIGTFHEHRLQSIRKLHLSKVLEKKNPYLFKAKNILLAQDLVKTILDAFLSSQEEAIFGDFFEALAVFINGKTLGGRKSSSEGIDLEFDKDGCRYLVAVKSGPNWGNSSQVRKMKEDFIRAKRVLRTSNSRLQVVAVNGCCYGRAVQSDKGDYLKFCGQKFWDFISGDPELYIEIIKPLGHKAKEKNQEFTVEYSAIINKFTQEFNENFCVDGKIDWDALVRFNSGTEKPKRNKTGCI
jgi:Type II restriction endonuclease EcoO109I